MTPKKYTQTENVIVLIFDLDSKSFVNINCTAFETITIRIYNRYLLSRQFKFSPKSSTTFMILEINPYKRTLELLKRQSSTQNRYQSPHTEPWNASQALGPWRKKSQGREL